MNLDSIVSQLKEERNRLDQVLALLTGDTEVKQKSGKRTMSPEARERIAAAQRARWAKQKKMKKAA